MVFAEIIVSADFRVGTVVGLVGSEGLRGTTGGPGRGEGFFVGVATAICGGCCCCCADSSCFGDWYAYIDATVVEVEGYAWPALNLDPSGELIPPIALSAILLSETSLKPCSGN